jgi:hypothetical protein
MINLAQQLSDAARVLTSENKPIRESIYVAFFDHLNDINPDDMPRKFQFIYESVKLRLTAAAPHGNISNDEAGHIAADILFLADVLHTDTRV